MTTTTEPNTSASNILLKTQALIESSRFSFLFVFIAGALLPLSFSPVDFYLLALVSPAIFFISLLHATPRKAAWLGWCFGMGFFGVGVSWGFVAIYVFGLSSIFASAILTFIGVSLMAAYISLQAYLSVMFTEKFKIKNRILILLIIFPLLWALLEWFRGWFLTGFPWLSLGYSQTGSYLSGYASVLGVFGVSWITALSSSLLLVVILSSNKNKLIYLSVLVLVWLLGYFFLQFNWTDKNGDVIKVSLVQGNVEQINKWDPDQFEKRKQRYLSLTQKHWDSDLILWPENS